MNLRILSPLLLAMPLASVAQTAVFTDDFTSGNDTLNGTSVPGGTPAASWTSWDIAATKAATTKPAIATGDFTMGLNSATTGGFGEAQAIFTSSPITLATTGTTSTSTWSSRPPPAFWSPAIPARNCFSGFTTPVGWRR